MRRKDSDRATVQWLFQKSHGQLARMIGLVVGNAVFAASATLFALACRGIVDGAVNHDQAMMTRYGAYLLTVIVMQLILRLACNSTSEYIRSKLAMCYRQDTLRELMKKEYAQTSQYHSGELLNRMFSDVQVITEGITGILPAFVNLVTRLVCAVAVLIALDKSFALIFLAAGGLLFAVSRLFRRRMKTLHKDVQEKEGRVRSFLQETVESLLIVKAFGSEQKMERTADDLQNTHFHAQMKRRTLSIFANAGFSFVFQMGYLYAMLWGAWGIFTGTMSYGTLTAILQLVGQVQAPFANLSGLMPKVYGMLASAERMMELERLPDEPKAAQTLSYADFERLELRNLSFSYGESKVLSRVSITIRKGEFVSLTGLSGGGKTTLFLLLLGAYQPTEGDVRFLSAKDSFHSGKETRGLFAYVPQGNRLFSGTVRENIAFLNEQASEEEIRHAAQIACADEFIQRFPKGYDTPIGENGLGVSQGQAQRIVVARALLSGAEILLLDEATSALDDETEARLLQNIAALQNRTCLIVTHRKAALAICSRHLVMEDGEIRDETDTAR